MSPFEAVAPTGVAAILLPCGCRKIPRDSHAASVHREGCRFAVEPRRFGVPVMDYPEGSVVVAPHTLFVPDDGGRAAAGFTGTTRDCACRSIAIATGLTYQEVYDLIAAYGRTERRSKRKSSRSHPRTGVYSDTMRRMLEREFGAVWTPCMTIGSGTTVHVRADELPATGRHVLRLSKHFAAWVDGVLRDTHDCSRGGTRAVYGYWTF